MRLHMDVVEPNKDIDQAVTMLDDILDNDAREAHDIGTSVTEAGVLEVLEMIEDDKT
jgi:hypothetical protein